MSYKVGSGWTVTARYVDVFTYDTFIVKSDQKKKIVPTLLGSG